MRKAFVYRLYTNKAQDKALTGLLDIARTFYNAALQERRDAWKVGVSINYYDQANQLKGIRQENPWCAALNCSATQDVLRRLDKTFKAFFRRCQSGEKPGYPRFKGRDRFNSVTFPSYGDGIRLADKLYVQNVGKVRINLHRPIEGRIKTVSLKRECGKWYVVFSCELAEMPAREPTYENPVGIDVGLTSFAVLSDGFVIDNPRYFRQGEEALAKRQRRLAARVKGSYRRRKARLLVAKSHLKVQRQRMDFQHKVARDLAQKYDFIAHEDLNIRGMVRNHCLAKSISDTAWGQFLRILCYKVVETGGTEVGVNPSGTSIDCSRCGFPVPKTLADRQHICPNCGLSMPRDLNASLNILALGLSVQGVDPEKLPALAGRVVTASSLQEPHCKMCDSDHFYKNGHTKQGKQALLCRRCGTVQSNYLSPYKGHYDSKVMRDAVTLRCQGVSLNSIRDTISRQHGVTVSTTALLDWQRKLGITIAKENKNKYCRKDTESMLLRLSSTSAYDGRTLRAVCGFAPSTKIEDTQLYKEGHILKKDGHWVVCRKVSARP